MIDADTSVVTNFGDVVKNWRVSDVADWLRGLDDCVVPYVQLLERENICGRDLFILDEGDLERIGVTNVGAQRVILMAIYQLSELCFSLDKKNLQSLSMKLGVQARSLHNELKYGIDRLNCHANAAFGWLPNDVLSHVSALVEDIKEIVGWLDRSPFDAISPYVTLRNTILSFASTIVQSARQRSTALTRTARDIQMACTQLCSIADKVVEDFMDPLILQTAYLERTVVKRSNPIEDLGINIESTANGVHIVSEVIFQSPADIAGKVEAGDEIVQFCGQTVVGWPLAKLASLWNETKSLEIQFLLKKRPQRYYGQQTLAGKMTGPGRVKLEKIKTAVVTPAPASGNHNAVQFRQQSRRKPRRRSSSVSAPRTPVEKIVSAEAKPSPPASPISPTLPHEQGNEENGDVLPWTRAPQRRATVSGGSPTLKRLSLHLNRNISVSPRPQSHWFNDPTGVVRNAERQGDVGDLDVVLVRSRLSRPMPNFRASLIDSRLYMSGRDDTQLQQHRKKRKNSWMGSQPKQQAADDVFDEDVLSDLVSQAVEAAPSESSEAAGSMDDDESILVEAAPDEVPLEAAIDEQEWELAPVAENEPESEDSGTEQQRSAGETSVQKTWSLPGRDSTAPKLARDPLATLPRSSQEKLRKFFGEGSVGSSTWYDSETETDDVHGSNPPRKSPMTSSQASVASSVWTSRFQPRQWKTELMSALGGGAGGHSVPKRFRDVLPSNLDSGSPVLTGMHRLTSTRKVSAPMRAHFIDPHVLTGVEEAKGFPLAARLKFSSYLPCDSIKAPDHVGWVYRARYEFESSAAKKWRKRWLVLKKDSLFVYRTAEDAKAEGVLWLPAYRACPAGPEYKTWKKNVFKLYNTYVCFYFCCHQRQDMVEWLQKLGLAAIGYSSTLHNVKEDESSEHQAEYYFSMLEDMMNAGIYPRRGVHEDRSDSPSLTGGKRKLVQTESFLSTLRHSWRRSQLTRENSNESSLSCHSEGAVSISSSVVASTSKPNKIRDPLHVRGAAAFNDGRSRSAGRLNDEKGSG